MPGEERTSAEETAEQGQPGPFCPALTLAFLADGALYLCRPGEEPQQVESAFGASVRQRTAEIHRRHAWKEQGRGAQFMRGGLLWGTTALDPEAIPVMVTTVSRGAAAGEVVFGVRASGVEAVCSLRLADGYERRLRHGAQPSLGGLAGHPSNGLIACSVRHRDGSSSLALLQDDGSGLAEVTEGDSVDTAPSWSPGPGRRIFYQSAGIGRDAAGNAVALGSAAIHELDLDGGEVEVLADDPHADLVLPRCASDGSLYYVRRPRPGTGEAVWGSLLDVLLFLPRLLHAVFMYLSFFVARYTGRPLTSAGGPRRQGADIRQMMVWSNLIAAEQAGLETGDDSRPGPPASWKLMRRREGRPDEPIAHGVTCFDLAPDGSVVYSNGHALWRLDPAGRRERVLAHPGVTALAVIPDQGS